MATSDASAAQIELVKALKSLQDVIQRLHTLPKDCGIATGLKSGSIGKYFENKAFDESDGPIETIDKAYLRVFQVSEPEKMVSRGKYGIAMVYNYFLHFSRLEAMEKDNGYSWLTDRVKRVVEITEERCACISLYDDG